MHNTDTVAYATHSGSYSTECKKEVHRLHTGTHVVHNNYSGTQHSQRYTTHMPQKHLGYLNVKLLSVVLLSV